MPLFIYEHPETKERIELLQSCHEEHSYTFAGVKWDRVWTTPQIATDTKIDPFSAKQFMAKTDKPGTLGDLWDRSNDLQLARAEKNGGIDPVSGKKPVEKKKKGKQDVNIQIG